MTKVLARPAPLTTIYRLQGDTVSVSHSRICSFGPSKILLNILKVENRAHNTTTQLDSIFFNIVVIVCSYLAVDCDG